MKRESIAVLLNTADLNRTVTIRGWVRTFRNDRFIAVNDGSTIHNVQVVVEQGQFTSELLKRITTNAAIEVSGDVVASQGKGQAVELMAKTLVVIGDSDPDEFPIQPKKHSLEFLREAAHLRFRTSTFGAVFRIRHAMTFAVHQYFHNNGFYNIHTPIVTGSDAEGAGEMFRVTTLDAQQPPCNEDGTVDYTKDFFGKETNLTVSGQLEAEMAALALGKVYTFGPTFRAENSNTTRHLAEFWMIEPEVAFSDLCANIELATSFLKFLVQFALEHCADDLQFLHQRREEEEKNKKQDERTTPLLEQLRFIADNEFEHITYTEAISILRNSKPNKKKKFNYLIEEWGGDIQTEHERFLVEKHFKKPVVITDYPKDIKSFYMRLNEDGKTVAAMDILFPGIGEIIGGSQREERHDLLVNRMKEMGVPTDELWWYLDSRKFGSVPHSGFGLGFERLIQFVTGMGNIRDVIAFPRSPKNAEF
jgi:asparaginyl-tRNA synthetase